MESDTLVMLDLNVCGQRGIFGSRYSRMGQAFENLKGYGVRKCFKGCLSQILLDPFFDTLTHLHLSQIYMMELSCENI